MVEKERYSHVITVWLKAEHVPLLKEYAQTQYRSVSGQVRYLVERLLVEKGYLPETDLEDVDVPEEESE